jgi:hypothetical protein
MYTKIISKLSKAYVEQYTREFILNNKFKLFRLLEHNRKNWCSLKNKPLSKAITEPTAMDVEVASYEELEPFFKFLDSNSVPIDNNWEKEPCMKFIKGALYQNKRLDLCKQVVGPNWIEILMNSLVNNTQIEHFLLGNNIIGTIGAKAIGNFLLNEHKPKIKTWYIAGNSINQEGIKFKTSVNVGVDIKVEDLKKSFDVIVLCIVENIHIDETFTESNFLTGTVI